MVRTENMDIEALRRQVHSTWSDQRDLYLTRLLSGGYFRSEAHALGNGQALEVLFPNPDYLVLSVRLETWGALFSSGEMDWQDCNFILRNALEEGLPGTVHALDMQGKMAAILNHENLDDQTLRGIVQDAGKILEVLEEEFGLTVTVAVSRVYRSILALPEARSDTERVFDYLALMDEDRPLTTYEELTHVHMSPSQTSYLNLESRLLGCIRASDFSGAQLVLHELIQGEFGDSKPTIDTVRFRVYGVVNTLLYMIDDIRDVVGNELIQKIDPGPRLTSAKSLSEIVFVMDDILEELQDFTGRKQQAVPDWINGAYAYVQESFRDPNVTVSSVADRFGLSATYCAKLFKEYQGVRLFDFISRLRLEAAKEALKSEKTLREIAEETGFSTALTMNRAFKRYEGTTPNKLREAMKTQ